jgi:Tfp pilus assembly PilM family ATPase
MNSILEKATYFFQKSFPTPKYLNFDPVAIDLSPDAIYFLHLKKNKIGLMPDKYEKISFPQYLDLCDENLPQEKKQIIIDSLIKLRKKHKLKFVFASLPEKQNYIFKIIVPKLAQKDIISFIRYQIDENVPLSANEVNFQYFILEQVNQEGDVGVIVTVFPKKIINLYTEIFEKSGLFPISFFSESQSLLASLVKRGDLNSYLLIRFSSNRASVAVLERGAIQYTTDIKINIDNALNSFESSDATVLKEELNKVLIYWFTNKKDFTEHRKIENVLISGLHAENIALIDYLEKVLKINVDTGNVWNNCFDSQKYPCKIEKTLALEYAIAIGLAIRCIKYA